MDKEFITYEQALALKKLDFDEPCFGYYVLENNGDYKLYDKCEVKNYFTYIEAPLYQQAFRWFREKHNLQHSVYCFTEELGNGNILWTYEIRKEGEQWQTLNIDHTSHEEAESACLDKLIEIVKNEQVKNT